MSEAARAELSPQGIRVTLIAPGIVDTAFYDDPVDEGYLTVDDVADAVVWALTRPRHVNVNEILLRSVIQEF
jgi:NADP-dependent 3-hydroxy acid dehydrogenase YdfG